MTSKKYISTAMAVAMVASSVAPVMAATTTSNEEIIGKNRTETAVKISKDGWKSAETVILVNDSAIPDALTATPLAYAKNAPVLLTGKDGLSKETADEIKRLGAKDVIMIGGDAVLTSKVEEGLKALKLKVDRIKGSTREETALAIAKRLDGIKDVSEIAVVNGVTGLADAVSVAAAAAEKGMPILLANPKSGLTLVEKFIKDESIKSSFIIGGDKVVSNEIVKNLSGKQRIEGANRNETNAKVIEKFYADRELDNLYVAKDGMENSGHLIDALAVGSLAAKNGAPVLIASKKLNEKQINVINTKRISTITQVGGNGNEKAFGELKEIEKSEIIKVKNEAELQEALKKANANDVIEIESSASISKDVTLSTNNAVEINVKGDLKGEVTVKAPNADIKNSGTIGTLVVEDGKNTTVTNASVGKIDKVEVSSSSENVKVENKGTITQVENNASGTTIENNGTISKPVTGTEKPSVEGNKPGGSTSGGGGGSSTPSVDQNKVKLVNTAKVAKDYKYSGSNIAPNDEEYNYVGTITVTGEESATVNFEGPYKSINLGSNEKKAAMDDMARYLGALHRTKDSNIEAIEYNGKIYKWSKVLKLKGSNWVLNVDSNETNTPNKNTLVSNIVSDANGEAPINLVLVDTNGNKANLTINFKSKFPAKVNDVYYETLAEAVESVTSSSNKTGEVKLTKDFTGRGIVIPSGSNITIDLENNIYTLNDPAVGSTGTETNGFQLLQDSEVTIKNGIINTSIESKNTKFIIQNYSNLMLEDITLEGSEITQIALSTNYGHVKLNNVGIKNDYKKDYIALDVYHWVSNYGEANPTTVEISNSNKVINGKITVSCDGKESCNYCKTNNIKKLKINSGEFKNIMLSSEILSQYVSKGKKLDILIEGNDYIVK